MNCVSWIKLVPVLIHLKDLYYNSSSISIKFNPSQLKPLFNTILIIFLIGFLFFLPYSTRRQDKYQIYQTIYQAKPVKFMTKLYTDHNILWVKHATNQKAESIRIVSFSKLDKRSTAALSSIQSMLNSLKNDRCSFIFTILFVHTTTPTICNKNPFFYFCQFSPPYSILTRSQNHLYNPH